MCGLIITGSVRSCFNQVIRGSLVVMRWGSVVGRRAVVFLGLTYFSFLVILMSGRAFGFWFGVEIGTVRFLVLCNSRTAVENEGSCKYYVIQGFSSVFLFVRLMVSAYAETEQEGDSCTKIFRFFIIIILWVKVGLFPFHFWVVPVLSRVGWGRWFWIAVVQKTSRF